MPCNLKNKIRFRGQKNVLSRTENRNLRYTETHTLDTRALEYTVYGIKYIAVLSTENSRNQQNTAMVVLAVAVATARSKAGKNSVRYEKSDCMQKSASNLLDHVYRLERRRKGEEEVRGRKCQR